MYRIIQYDDAKLSEWDKFIDFTSVNGTFLNKRIFLSYHGDRFDDCSIMVYKKSNLVAVFPAAKIDEEVISHPGSTFGGIIFCAKVYNCDDLSDIISSIEEYYYSVGLTSISSKQPNSVFFNSEDSLLEYLYSLHGYKMYSEINTHIDLLKWEPHDFSHWNSGQIENYKKGSKHNYTFANLVSDEEISQFYVLLCNNLVIHHTKPVHSLNQLLILFRSLIPNNIEFYAIKDENDKIVAGTMLFLFHNSGVIHTQYLAQDYEYNSMKPMTLLLYNLMEMGKKRNFSRITWGISTENKGKVLNYSLLRFKESFGSCHSLNKTFMKKKDIINHE